MSRAGGVKGALRTRALWMIPVAALAMVGTLPGRTRGLGLIAVPMMENLRLSAIALGQINLWATLIGAAFCVPCGWMIDRRGLRLSLTVVLLCLGAVVLAMSRVENTTALFFAVTLSRGFGRSALSLASLAVVGKWFAGQRLGSAMGTYSVLMSIGFAAAFPAVGHIVQIDGWRPAWTAVGAALLVMACLAWVVTRDPDAASGAEQEPAADTQFGASLRQALGTPAFWVFALASSCCLLVSSGISLFNQAVLAERGFSAGLFYQITALSFLVGMAANLAGGLLAERISLRWQMAAAMALISAALVFFPRIDSTAEAYAYAVVMAAAGGLVTVVFFAVWAHAFGKRELGRIQGAAQMMTVIASAIGPVLLGYSHDKLGSYSIVFPALSLATLVFAIAAALTPTPGRQGTATPPA